MQGDPELRQDIDAVMAIRYPGHFAAAWEDLMKLGGHRLRIVGSDSTYNCHAHGLRIEQCQAYQDLARDRNNQALVQGDFITHLIGLGELKIVDGQSYATDNIVIYFRCGKPTHSARVLEKDGLLLSKWGGNELLEHGLWEIPTYYGNEYKVAIAPDPKRSIELLEDWLPKISLEQ